MYKAVTFIQAHQHVLVCGCLHATAIIGEEEMVVTTTQHTTYKKKIIILIFFFLILLLLIGVDYLVCSNHQYNNTPIKNYEATLQHLFVMNCYLSLAMSTEEG